MAIQHVTNHVTGCVAYAHMVGSISNIHNLGDKCMYMKYVLCMKEQVMTTCGSCSEQWKHNKYITSDLMLESMRIYWRYVSLQCLVKCISHTATSYIHINIHVHILRRPRPYPQMLHDLSVGYYIACFNI